MLRRQGASAFQARGQLRQLQSFQIRYCSTSTAPQAPKSTRRRRILPTLAIFGLVTGVPGAFM